jgi:hypothetical protein
MERSVSSPTDLMNFVSTWNTIDHTRQKHATPSLRKVTVTSVSDATLFTPKHSQEQVNWNGNKSTATTEIL